MENCKTPLPYFESYDNIILKAIYNHNKFKIEGNLNDKELLFCKIIRDADKIDILFEGTNIFWKNEIELINNGKIQDSVYNQIIRNETIERTKGRKIELIDKVISVLAFVFDINFNESLEIINKNDYINKILRRFDFKDKETIEKIEEISKVINNYIQERTNKG